MFKTFISIDNSVLIYPYDIFFFQESLICAFFKGFHSSGHCALTTIFVVLMDTVVTLLAGHLLFIPTQVSATLSIRAQAKVFDLRASSPGFPSVPPCPATARHVLWLLEAKLNPEMWCRVTLQHRGLHACRFSCLICRHTGQ